MIGSTSLLKQMRLANNLLRIRFQESRAGFFLHRVASVGFVAAGSDALTVVILQMIAHVAKDPSRLQGHLPFTTPLTYR